MGLAPESERNGPLVWALGALPPPITGMTLLTEKVVDGLREKTPLRVVTWAAGDSRQRFPMRVLRLLRTAKALAILVLHGPVRDARVYVTANSKGGLLMTG